MLMYIHALLRRIKPQSDIFRTLSNPYIYNRVIFRALTYLEPEASSKACQHARQSSIFRALV